ncbi:MAG: hypothetical protein ACR2N9_06015, partial [Acidimicrobiia bacterium]
MSIYDLSQALKRYRIPVIVAFLILILGVLYMTFTFDSGKPVFRAGLTYESSVQIAVVPPGTDSLITSSVDTETDLASSAVLFASLLESDEAAKWIGEANGYVLEEPVSTNVDRDATIIQVSVAAPSAEQARAAALSTFAWLNKRLLEPIATADFPSPPTTLAPVILDRQFTSFMNVTLAEGLADAQEEVFVAVEPDDGTAVTLSVAQNAGRTVRTRSLLEPVMTVVVSLLGPNDEVLDTVRLAPPTAPLVVDVVPELDIEFQEDAIRTTRSEEGDTFLTLVPSSIGLIWAEGTPAAPAGQINEIDTDLALLTVEPGFTSTGGRRGPILGISALIVGTVLILTTVIVVDIWRRERDAALAAANPADETVPEAAATLGQV